MHPGVYRSGDFTLQAAMRRRYEGKTMKKVPAEPLPQPTLDIRGVSLYQGFLDRQEQERMVGDLRAVVAAAPLFQPETRRGQKMSVRMTSAGSVGWVSDRRGYRYEPSHPQGTDWPPIPASVLSVWDAVAGSDRRPDCCLVNYYGEGARMGLHQDKDEADFEQPVVSISLGDDALFRIGNLTRGGKTDSVWLTSGDVLVMGGEARLVYHGIDRLRPGSSALLPNGGRINLTLRVAH
jgi:alkylated DNA repair protein (DNA oxidative demethylase)